MRIIDRYAYNSRLRHIDPTQKVGLSLAVVLLCLALNEPPVGLMAAGGSFALAVYAGGVPAGAFGRLLLAESFFLTLTTLGLLVNISLAPPNEAWVWQAGPLWFSSSPEAAAQTLAIITRALGSAAALNFLAMSTPLVDLIELFRRLRLPALLIEVMMVMYRFIFTLLESLSRIYIAQESRLGYHSGFGRGMVSAGLLGGRLFVDAYQRSHRLQLALEARGYEDTLRVLPTVYRSDWGFQAAGAAVIVGLLLAWMVG